MTKYLVPILFLTVSCGTIKKWGIRSATPVFEDAGPLTTREKNWNTFRESTPANLKLTEILYLQDENNMPLLAQLVRGYAGYAYAVSETLLLQDELAGVENSPWKREAISHYTKAFDYGLTYLEKRQVKRSDVLNLDEVKLSKKLKYELGKKDIIALLYTAQAWGSLINLQKDNVALVSQVPKVKVLFDEVCKMDPEIDNGVCDIFYAQYEASRPRMLGGNPEKAKELFAAAIQKHPMHLLMRTSYIQYSIVPAMDAEAYDKEASALRTEFAKFEDLNRDDLQDHSPYKSVPELNLYNAIAKKRFDIFEQHKKKIF
jgi:hypothetical protein